MARKRPPQHRADTPGHFIPRSDASFDRDRFDREVAKMKDEGLDPASHPVERYYSGKTRADLQAADVLFGQPVCAGDYFKLELPETFVLRRLDWAQWHEVVALVEQGNFAKSQVLACRYGIAGVENSTLKLKGAESGLLSHDDMQALHDADPSLITALGFASWMYSRPLTDSEKKAAG